MVFYLVEFRDGKLEDQVHKKALKKLSSIKLKGEKKFLPLHEFVRFKRVLELYMKALKLVVRIPSSNETVNRLEAPKQVTLGTQTPPPQPPVGPREQPVEEVSLAEPVQYDAFSHLSEDIVQDLHKYCRTLQRRPLDLIVDAYNPKKLPVDAQSSHLVYLKLDDDVDEQIADDILALGPGDINFLSRVHGDFKTNQIIRRLGSSFYLAIDAQRQQKFTKLHQIMWKETMSIMEFNHNFNLAISSCTELQLQENVLDQVMLYFEKINQNRKDNNALLTARSLVRPSEQTSLEEAMENVASIILNQSPDGRVAFDRSTIQFMSAPPVSKKVVKTTPKQCKGKEAKCSNNDCKENNQGHTTEVCSKFRRQRMQFTRRKRRHGKEPFGRKDSWKKPPDEQVVNKVTTEGMSDVPQGFTNLYTNEFHYTEPAIYATVATNTVTAGVDTCSSCMAITDARYFETLDRNHTTSLNLLNTSSQASGFGIVALRFTTSTPEYRFPAYFVPNASMHILSNKLLFLAGITPVHDPKAPRLILTDGSVVPMRQDRGISLVELVPPPTLHVLSTIHRTAGPTLWHKRLLHIGNKTLSSLGFGRLNSNCDVCLSCKPRLTALKLDPSWKDIPTKKGELLSVDLMVPHRGAKGAVLLTVDIFTRFTFGEIVRDYKADTLLQAFKLVVLRLGSPPLRVILDRQTGFLATDFQRYLVDNGILYRFAPPNRHGEYNGVVERAILSIRTLARCALASARLSSDVWQFAVMFAIYIKNRLPHAALDGKTPFTEFHGRRPEWTHIRVFGCLCYTIVPPGVRGNKLAPIGRPGVFLGFDPRGSHHTAIILDPVTSRLSFRHVQDVWFNEEVNYAQFRAARPPVVAVGDTVPDFSKHDEYLCESPGSSSDGSSDDSSVGARTPSQPSISAVKNSGTKVLTTAQQSGVKNNTEVNERADNSETVEKESVISRKEVGNRKPYRTRSGRSVRAPQRYDEEVYVIVTTSQKFTYDSKERTQRQREKMKARILKARKARLPGTIQEINISPNREKYWEAVRIEMDAMQRHGVLETVPRGKIPGSAEIGNLIVLLTKKRDGRFKSRLVFNGRRQKFRITEFYGSPTLRMETLSCALTLAAHRGYEFKTADVSTAFLYADLPEGILLFAEIPQGHADFERRESCVLRIRKNIYGLKEGPRLWWSHFNKTIIQTTDLRPCAHDECAYYGKEVIMLVYVDDLLLLGLRQKIMQTLHTLSKHFKMTQSKLNEDTDFLGCIIKRCEDGSYELTQEVYTKKLLAKFAPLEKICKTPLPATFDPIREMNSKNVAALPYMEKLGSLGYLRATRFDLLFPLQQLAKYASKPTEYMQKCLDSVFYYLKGTSGISRHFYPKEKAGGDENTLVAVTDASFATEATNRHSIGGYFMYYRESLIDANSSSQKRIATSAPEAELFQIFRTTKRILYIKGVMTDFGEQNLVTSILTDSSSSIGTINNPVSTRYKYLAVYVGFLKQMIKTEDLKIIYLSREYNFADMLTKQLDCETFWKMWKMATSKFRWIHHTKEGARSQTNKSQ